MVFVFPGQGAQWAGMGRELAAVCPVFAARLAECGAALAPHVDWDLAEVIAGAPGAPGLESAEVAQPVLWAVMVSLAAVWQAAGVVPDAVLGHSQGEIAAATVAGILTLEDAARVVAVRGRALSGLDAAGGMVSVVMPEPAVRELLAPVGRPAGGGGGERPGGHGGIGRHGGAGRVRGGAVGPARAALAGAGQRLRGALRPGGELAGGAGRGAGRRSARRPGRSRCSPR